MTDDLWAEDTVQSGKQDKGLEPKYRPRLKPIHRQQLMWRVVDVERLVPEDHTVRAIWELVGKVDLNLYYKEIRAVEGVAGRTPVDPRVLISVWVYAYSQGVSSAREISKLSEYDPAYQWLTGMEPINYHTLSDFRVNHQKGLDALFTQVLGLLSAEGLVTLERVMHDGTKVVAHAGTNSFRREETLRTHLQLARQHVAQMGDPQSVEEVSSRVASARRRAALEKQQRLEKALAELEVIQALQSEDSAKTRVSLSDPEARTMKHSNGGYAPSYNVQISTDAVAKVIVGVGVSQSSSDSSELVPALERIEENLGQLPTRVVVDGGFTSRSNIIELAQQGVDLIAPMGEEKAPSAAHLDQRGRAAAFRPEAFVYQAQSDTYLCPAGKTLTCNSREERVGQIRYKYRARASDCRRCAFKIQCCPDTKGGRSLVRRVQDPVVMTFRQKMQTLEAQAIYKQRSEVAEFPFAWMKEKMGLRQFRLQGRAKAGIEALWACLAYNIQQWIRLCWRVQWVTNPVS